MRNARFWTRWNGDWVKLTLRPNETLTMERGGQTEEGWEHVYEDYTLEEHNGVWEVVTNTGYDAMDCDGRFSRGGTYVCPLHSLSIREPYEAPEDVTGVPEWVELDSHQRDYEAERAGY